MTDLDDLVTPTPTVAPLTNVGLVLSALKRAQARSLGLPGIVVLHSPSGWGKSTAAAYAAVNTQAYYVAMQSIWTRRAFLMNVAREMGLQPAPTLPEVAAQITEQLMLSGRPLLIDEADVLTERPGGAGLLKDLYESTQGVIMLIGEEKLPQRLQRWERLHGRVLEWVSAQPASLTDARALTRIYAHGTEIADDLLAKLVQLARGSVRRIAVNLDGIRTEARKNGWTGTVSLTTWGDRPLYTGEPPARRV